MDNMAATRQLIRLALEEDIGLGDLTALAVPPDSRARARLVAKEACVVSGLDLATMVLDVFGAQAYVALETKDGQSVPSGAVLMHLEGRARDLLTTERTILNLLQRTCGVATQSRRYKDASGSIVVMDTRKTMPGFRYWDKKAVRDGGCVNHRARLDEAILIKENHIRASGSIRLALANLKSKVSEQVPIEVEVTSWDEIEECLQSGVSKLLLDNFLPEQLTDLVPRIRQRDENIFLEASGGVNLSNISQYSKTGVDAVSVGALTHSVKAADLSLLFDFE